MCDEHQLKQAFSNIILNSIEAMPQGGKLTITTEDIPTGALRITIKDTGTGIPKDKIKHLFDPFYTTKEKGTGLGLFIVHQIIENNKGKINIESKEGKGTTVTMVFGRG
jgi:two-component system, sporulation sensor kinase E